MAMKKVLTDLEVVADPPHYWGRYGSEDYWERYERYLEAWAKEFNDFVRDHRSQDEIGLYVRRVYEDQCEHCGSGWEVFDDGQPACCDEAVEEWKATETAPA